MTYLESAYQFDFTKEWLVIQFDEHQFYKVLSGQSLSGVDFSAVYNDALYLMEVKNFRMHHQEAQAIASKQLIHDLNDKLKDSIQIIEIINKYYDQKRRYKFFAGLIDKLPFLNKDWYYWRCVKKAILKNKQLQFVLFINGLSLEEGAIQNLLSDHEFYDKKIKIKTKIIALAHSGEALPGIRWEKAEIEKGL